MKIEILGCSGSIAKGFNTTSILVNDTLLIDAGSAASVLPDERLSKIDDILITHSHIDHIKELPFIADSVFTNKNKGINIWGSSTTIDVLEVNIFNGLIWPDIRQLELKGDSLIRFKELPLKDFYIGNISITPIPVDHMMGSLGFLLNEDDRYVLFSGDTGYTKGLFDVVKSLGAKLKVFFVEASFPDRMLDTAVISKHLTPSMVWKSLDENIPKGTRVILYHIKPRFLEEIVANLPKKMEYIKGGEAFDL